MKKFAVVPEVALFKSYSECDSGPIKTKILLTNRSPFLKPVFISQPKSPYFEVKKKKNLHFAILYFAKFLNLESFYQVTFPFEDGYEIPGGASVELTVIFSRESAPPIELRRPFFASSFSISDNFDGSGSPLLVPVQALRVATEAVRAEDGGWETGKMEELERAARALKRSATSTSMAATRSSPNMTASFSSSSSSPAGRPREPARERGVYVWRKSFFTEAERKVVTEIRLKNEGRAGGSSGDELGLEEGWGSGMIDLPLQEVPRAPARKKGERRSFSPTLGGGSQRSTSPSKRVVAPAKTRQSASPLPRGSPEQPLSRGTAAALLHHSQTYTFHPRTRPVDLSLFGSITRKASPDRQPKMTVLRPRSSPPAPSQPTQRQYHDQQQEQQGGQGRARAQPEEDEVETIDEALQARTLTQLFQRQRGLSKKKWEGGAWEDNPPPPVPDDDLVRGKVKAVYLSDEDCKL
jgi:hypothetical protein